MRFRFGSRLELGRPGSRPNGRHFLAALNVAAGAWSMLNFVSAPLIQLRAARLREADFLFVLTPATRTAWTARLWRVIFSLIGAATIRASRPRFDVSMRHT